MEGKKTLYQRVLANPGSRLFPEPEESADGQGVVPFTMLYVYERKTKGKQEWLRVGIDTHGSSPAWMPANQTIPWHQALTVTFRDPKEVDRVLLFRDRDALKDLVERNDLKTYKRYYAEAVQDKHSESSPVIAIQPPGRIDIEKDFYLVPIKEYQEVYVGTERGRLLQVASVPLGAASNDPPLAARPAQRSTGGTYRSAIVFVVDATQSMRPYIDRMREVVHRVYDSIDAAGLRDKVSFGLTAFRDALGSGLESDYVTRDYVTLDQGGDPQAFFQEVDTLAPSDVSNEDFIEDSLAGIKSALEHNPWQEFDARHIVLITDAGGREADDPRSSTGLSSKALRRMVLEQGVAIWALHLRTPKGAFNHGSAERQYRALSDYPGVGELYYGVKLGKVDELGSALELLSTQITEQVAKVAQGILPEPVEEEQAGEDDIEVLRSKVARLGYALQMRYLEKTRGHKPPRVFDGWLVDRDLSDPKKRSIDVRVLMSRDQLSDLRNGLQQALELAEEGVLSPGKFLHELKRMAAKLSRSPVDGEDGNETPDGGSLSELGYVSEYVDGLPYLSEVTGLSLEDWEEWPAEQQLAFVFKLESKVSYYQALHDHTDLWVSLDGGPVTGDSVFPVSLDMLP